MSSVLHAVPRIVHELINRTDGGGGDDGDGGGGGDDGGEYVSGGQRRNENSNNGGQPPFKMHKHTQYTGVYISLFI